MQLGKALKRIFTRERGRSLAVQEAIAKALEEKLGRKMHRISNMAWGSDGQGRDWCVRQADIREDGNQAGLGAVANKVERVRGVVVFVNGKKVVFAKVPRFGKPELFYDSALLEEKCPDIVNPGTHKFAAGLAQAVKKDGAYLGQPDYTSQQLNCGTEISPLAKLREREKEINLARGKA